MPSCFQGDHHGQRDLEGREVPPHLLRRQELRPRNQPALRRHVSCLNQYSTVQDLKYLGHTVKYRVVQLNFTPELRYFICFLRDLYLFLV